LGWMGMLVLMVTCFFYARIILDYFVDSTMSSTGRRQRTKGRRVLQHNHQQRRDGEPWWHHRVFGGAGTRTRKKAKIS
jgi:hypothetical protein